MILFVIFDNKKLTTNEIITLKLVKKKIKDKKELLLRFFLTLKYYFNIITPTKRGYSSVG